MRLSQREVRASENEDVWVKLDAASNNGAESLADRVRRVEADLDDIGRFYNISISSRRHERLGQYYSEELGALSKLAFDSLSQEDKVDYLLLRNFLRRKARQLELEKELEKKIAPLLPFASLIVSVCEARQDVEPLQAEKTAQRLDEIGRAHV